jgi:hypothetical protein
MNERHVMIKESKFESMHKCIRELEAAIRQHRDDVHLHLGNAHTDLDLKLYAALEEKK